MTASHLRLRHPWTSPVYFAPDGDRSFLWLSHTGADHSRNLAADPRVSLVIFDSTVPPYHGRAVYAAGEAHEVPADGVDEALTAYPRPGAEGAATLGRESVTGDAPYRLYRATASRLWVLCPGEPGQACTLHGVTKDHRAQVF